LRSRTPPPATILVDEFDANYLYGALERKFQACQFSTGTPSPPGPGTKFWVRFAKSSDALSNILKILHNLKNN